MSKKWFITGANRGFGLKFAEAALDRGDKVAATARDSSTLEDLIARYKPDILPLQLDVTSRAGVFAAIDEAWSHFGEIDIVVNNAGYGLFGAVEEISFEQLRRQMEVNFFGSFHVTQASLPKFRHQEHGHVVQISSMGGVVAFANLGAYHASKWALEGLTDSLAQEVKHFGINVTLIEPGGFATDWGNTSAVHAAPLQEYQFLRDAMNEQRQNLPPGFLGNPKATAKALLKVVDAQQPPLRVFFGKFPLQIVPEQYSARLQLWRDWEALSLEANG